MHTQMEICWVYSLLNTEMLQSSVSKLKLTTFNAVNICALASSLYLCICPLYRILLVEREQLGRRILQCDLIISWRLKVLFTAITSEQ